ncbi:sulfatase [Rhodopirellula bahusiensis]|uniref:Iduronate-2-sulfatase n=1 Tax=Rhodopirellula bahusiensis TaxID=2014065 RepID=A0A2G1WCQ4_9BACT|nr:sulfatase [Rhodopirellula bahusiensis]PHQ36610.1 iduronate-2-sulfatase [Rhodopirellula bahusiensis]
MPALQPRHLFLGLVSLVCSLPMPASAQETSPSKPLNVLMIAVDDLRPELGCYGKSFIHSPNIDRLAASGMRFDRAYCQVAVCGASRASLMSGCRPETTQCWNFKTLLRSKMPDVLTLPQHLSRNGYETGFLGKVYHSASDDAAAWTVDANEWAPRDRSKGKGYVQELPRKRNPANSSEKPGPSIENGGDVPDNAYADGHNAERAVAMLERFATQDKPFFLAVGFLKPHLPFNAPGKYWDLYDRDAIEIPSREDVIDGLPYARSSWGELKNYTDIPAKTKMLDDDKTRELIHGYRAAVSYMDAQVGKVLDALEANGQRENTIVVLWGDHGWYVGDFGDWCKHTNYEIATRVPLIVSAPGVPAGETKSLVELVDVFPTLCELTGVPVPKHCQGKSIAGVVRDPELSVRPAAFSQYKKFKPGVGPVLGTSIRTERFRYTEYVSSKTGKLEDIVLIDLDKDPGAIRNVASDPAYQSFLPQLHTWCEQSATGL